MKTNMGTADRLIRLLIALVIILLYVLNVISGTIAMVGIALAVVFILTSTISYCPLYAPFNLSTAKKKQVKR